MKKNRTNRKLLLFFGGGDLMNQHDNMGLGEVRRIEYTMESQSKMMIYDVGLWYAPQDGCC